MAAVTLDVTRLTMRRAGRLVLDDLCLSATQGSLVAVLGLPGSGKTALMRVLAGFARPAEGLVTHDGKLVLGIPPHRRGAGVVQQPDALLPTLSLADNIGLPLRLRGMRRAARAVAVETMLDLVQLADAGGLRPADATSAQRRRALLGRAAVFGPRVLLLDDPSGDQDAEGHVAMRDAIRRVHALLGATTILATRHGPEATALASRIAIIESGRIVQVAEPAELQERPQNEAVAALMGSMNQLPGLVAAIEDDIAAVRLDCGPVAFARSAGPLVAGDRCMLSVGPGRIAIAPVSAADMGDRAMDAMLIETQFLGETFRLRLLLGTGAELLVSRPAAAGLRGLSPGRHVAIAWQPYHALAFPQAGRALAGPLLQDRMPALWLHAP